jgi:hypothetical protein
MALGGDDANLGRVEAGKSTKTVGGGHGGELYSSECLGEELQAALDYTMNDSSMYSNRSECVPV